MPTYSQAGRFGPAAISGAPAGAPLRVQDASGSDAVLYADASKNKTVGPIVQSNDAGLVTFFADPGTYTVRWAGGSASVTVSGGALDSTGQSQEAYLAANLLAVGEETFSREYVTSATVGPTGSGQIRFTYFTARKGEVTTQVRMYTGTTAAAATPTLCRIGLWEVAADGSLTLVAATANDTTLFAATSTAYTRSWAAPYAKTAGQRYAFGALVVTGTTLPLFVGQSFAIHSAEMNVAPALCATLTGQTDLPASVAAGSLTTGNLRVYGAVLP